MKRSIFPIMLILPAMLLAQNARVFKATYMPEKTYNSTMEVKLDGTLTFDGSQEAMREILESGITTPAPVKMISTLEYSIATGKKDNDLIPVRFEYKKTRLKMEMMGENIDQEMPFSNFVIYGTYSPEDYFKIDSVRNFRGPEAEREKLSSQLAKNQKLISFPDKPLKPGDSFEQKQPLNLPIKNVENLAMMIDATYTLKEIKNGLGYFSINFNVNNKISNEEQQIEVTGSGTGTSIFDLNNNYLTEYKTNYEITVKVKIEEVTMIMKMKSDSNLSVKLD